MENFTNTMKEAAFATNPREFDLPAPTTLEEIMEKLNARAAAFQMPFKIKGGVPGPKKSIVMLRSPVRVQFNKPEVKPALDLTKKGE